MNNEARAAIAEIEEVEKKTGLYLSDPIVSIQNAGSAEAVTADQIYAEAGVRAEDAGFDINALIGRIVF